MQELEIDYQKEKPMIKIFKNIRKKLAAQNKVASYLRYAVGKKSEEIVDHLKKTAFGWLYGLEPDDDVTFVVIKVK